MTDWYAEVTAKTGPLTEDEQIELAENLGVITHDSETGRTAVTYTVEAPTLRQATDHAMKEVRDGLRAIAGTAELTGIRVLSLFDWQTEQENPGPLDVVGSTEGGEILGVSRQRFEELARTNSDFPPHVAELARGKLYTRYSIEAFDARWERRRTGRPKKATA